MSSANKGKDFVHMQHECEEMNMHALTVLTCLLPPSQTAPIKACVISELAAMKSQPRAHLFKRKNNEFFVASHLPVTINLGFLQISVRRSVQQGPFHC